MPASTLCRAMCSDSTPAVKGVSDAVDAVDGDHRVGGLRGNRRSGRAHRDPEVRKRKRGRVIDPVPDHRTQLPLTPERPNDLKLVFQGLLRIHAVNTPIHGRRVQRPSDLSPESIAT